MENKVHQECLMLQEYGFKFCVVGDELKQNELFMESIQHFKLPVEYSSDGLEHVNQGTELTTIFVLNEFDGDSFTNLHKAGQRIFGPTTVVQYAKKNEILPANTRPLYTAAMKNLVISFTGFRIKEELTNIVSLIHHMGGSIRKDFNMSKTTHLVSTPSGKTGEKYRYAVSLGIPVMTAEWVYQTWSRRRDIDCCATNEELMQFKLLPFVGCKMAFLGYKEEEETHMIDVAMKNGGEVVDAKDLSTTHIVIEDGFTVRLSSFGRDAFVLKNEWFWACIQIEAKAEEGLYIYEAPNHSLTSSSQLIMPVRGNKRKRLESVARQLAMESLQENEIFSPELKKKPEIAKLSISGSFLDATMSPDKSMDVTLEQKEDRKLKSPPLDIRPMCPRQQVCFEFFQTESNYVGILHTIITVFKQPLENPEQVGGILLAPAEIKIIFGNLPPIYEIHQQIRNELSEIIHNWTDEHRIGDVILKHAQCLMKSYPPFINFFEKTKSLLNSCDSTKPRFHAFLKRCQSKPECGRQSLQELLIRPVQRLPSVILLLNDILKHTPKNNPDNQALEKAIQALKDVLMHINEDKRKTEGQVEMFDIVNDIENCPPTLLSSHRNLVSKVDCQEITDLLSKKGGAISLFLFTDVLEICKKRGKVATTASKSPSVISLTGTIKVQPKTHKHLELIPLSHIKRVVDIVETEECKNVFAIVLWSNKELKELMYVFLLIEEIEKVTFLRTLCRQIANSVCRADSENLLISLEPEQLDLHESDVSANLLTKALSKTKSKIGRALSFRKTPTKRGLSRAVSSIISPLMNFGTPSGSMGPPWRLSSVTNLTELVQPCSSLTPSPIVGQKRKSSSMGLPFGRFISRD